jgi:hypothetical protein
MAPPRTIEAKMKGGLIPFGDPKTPTDQDSGAQLSLKEISILHWALLEARAASKRSILAGLLCLAAGPASARVQDGHSIIA